MRLYVGMRTVTDGAISRATPLFGRLRHAPREGRDTLPTLHAKRCMEFSDLPSPVLRPTSRAHGEPDALPSVRARVAHRQSLSIRRERATAHARASARTREAG